MFASMLDRSYAETILLVIVNLNYSNDISEMSPHKSLSDQDVSKVEQIRNIFHTALGTGCPYCPLVRLGTHSLIGPWRFGDGGLKMEVSLQP